MSTRRLTVAIVAALLALGMGSCGGDDDSDAGGDGGTSGGELSGKIAVLLPDSKSSDRWETADRRFFEQGFKAAGLSKDDYIISNAEGDPATQRNQAEQAITVGREGHPARQPRSGQRRGDHRRRQVAGRDDDRLRPPDRRRRRRLLRLRRRDRGRAAAGQGPDRGPQGQGFRADRDPLRGAHGLVRHRSQEGQHRGPQEQAARTSTSRPSRPCRTGTARRR